MATFALLQASIVAVSSDMFSVFRGKPAVNKISIFLPGTPRRFFAKVRIDSSIERVPKSASALLKLATPFIATCIGGAD